MIEKNPYIIDLVPDTATTLECPCDIRSAEESPAKAQILQNRRMMGQGGNLCRIAPGIDISLMLDYRRGPGLLCEIGIIIGAIG